MIVGSTGGVDAGVGKARIRNGRESGNQVPSRDDVLRC
jgi:hypothetical protein